MGKRKTSRWMPHARPAGTGSQAPTGHAFRTEWIDLDRGIRVGNLEPHERITQILKYNLTRRHEQTFTVDRWGRGEYWQWICWVPRPNRDAKPISSDVNFGCAKFYITADRDGRTFESGMQIERAPLKPRGDYPRMKLEDDWDWHVLMRSLRKGGALERELQRLVCEDDFIVHVGSFGGMTAFDKTDFTGAAAVKRACRAMDDGEWGGMQLYYPMPEKELRATGGRELVDAILAVYEELVPVMNLCMGLPCLKQDS